MELALGPVIGTVGGDSWGETGVEALTLTRTESRTLMTVAPPPTESLVVAVRLDHSATTDGGVLRIGGLAVPLTIGTNRVVAVVSTSADIVVQAGTRVGSHSWSFTGIVYTVPFPG